MSSASGMGPEVRHDLRSTWPASDSGKSGACGRACPTDDHLLPVNPGPDVSAATVEALANLAAWAEGS
jgi:hypothetical protein